MCAEETLETIRQYITTSHFHIISISESWLSEMMNDTHVHMDGYTLTRLDWQVPGKTGGGLIAFIKDGITFSDTQLSTHNLSNEDFEIQWLVILIMNKKLQVYS